MSAAEAMDPVKVGTRARGPARAVSASENGVHPMIPVMTAVGVTVLVVMAISYGRSVGLVTALWGASGLAVAVWLRTSRGAVYDLCFAGLIAIGFLAGNLLVGNSRLISAMFTIANVVDVTASVMLARWLAPSLNLGSVLGTARFLFSAAVLGPIPAACLASVCLHFMTGSNVVAGFETWWFGHALSVAVIGSLGLALTRRQASLFATPWRMIEAIVLFAALVGACALVFTPMDLPLSFLILPLLLLIAVRFRMLGVTLALCVLTIWAVVGSLAGYGPFREMALASDRATMAQLLVLCGYMPILLVASLLEERDLLAARAKAGMERAERASEAKSRLLANVAHEIKSPVSGVIGIGDLWRSGQLGPVNGTQAEMADMLVKTARQVEALTHDLLDVARAESGAVKLELRPTDASGVLDDVRRVMLLRPEARDVRIEVVTEGDGLVALADSQRLAQVIGNLGINALKYGASGGMVILKARRREGMVRIEVIDRGPGLTPEKQAQLFEPFNRLGLERSSVEGHGIGLALAKRLTELQGGTIGVESRPGEGAVFWVELALA